MSPIFANVIPYRFSSAAVVGAFPIAVAILIAATVVAAAILCVKSGDLGLNPKSDRRKTPPPRRGRTVSKTSPKDDSSH